MALEYLVDPLPLPLLLVVDDDPWMRQLLKDVLSADWLVEVADSGGEALRMLGGSLPVAVLSDLVMPDIDGLMLCNLIRSDPRLAHLPVMVLSANDAGEVKAAALATVDEFMGKPFHAAELIVRLKKLISRGQLRSSGGGTPAPTPLAGSEAPEQAHLRAFQQRTDAAIMKSVADPLFTVDDLARHLAVSPRQLRRRMLPFASQGPNAYIRDVRLRAAREALELGTFGTVAEVAASVGMTPAYFSRAYRAWMGFPPSKGGRNAG